VAKKKRRTPPPPRPVQAPKVRQGTAAGRPRDPRRTRYMFIGLIVAIVAIALVVAVVAFGGGGGGASDSELAIGGCVARTFDEADRQHATTLPEGYEYNSFPPSNGTHNPVPAIWNIYDEPVRQMLLIHNLEHGGIVVQHGDQVPAEELDRIRAWYADDPNAKIVAPLPSLGDKVAVTAWTHVMTCPGFNEEAFDTFTESFRYQGPERFPESALQPGT
jgi:hypothetical protein